MATTSRSSRQRSPGRMRRTPRFIVAFLTGTLVVGLAASALAVPVAPTDSDGSLKTRTGRLTQVGPVAEHGFPAWFRDSNGLRLEACTTLDDPLCSTLPDEVPNPDAPVSYPDNFPGEFFYQLAGAEVTGPGVDLTVGMDLEGAWAAEEVTEGDQMVFGRVRLRDKSIAAGEYRVTHPYGVDQFVVGGDGINYTQDIGTTPGAFGQVLASRVGPFLRWDPAVAPAAPAGYVGDPSVDHKVVGSPYGTNYVSVERKTGENSWTELARTDLFSIQGRLATNAGVDVQEATYSVGADGAGFVDVYATSDANQSIHVKDAGLGFIETRLEGDRGVYYGRYATSSAPDGKSVTIANVGDTPVAQKQVKLTDVVTIHHALYDADKDVLTVSASSSDQDSTPGHLSIMGKPFVDGLARISTVAPTATVTVTSDKGGSATAPVVASGAGMQADKPVAAGFASPTDVAPGQRVTLTGTGSSGTISDYTWRQVSATDANRVVLSGASTSVASFNAPADFEGSMEFELVVKGPAGTSEPVVVPVNVVAPDPSQPTPKPTADAGADQTVRRGATVTLDGSKSALVDTYAWSQVSGPPVTLTGAASAKPTFVLPLMALPTSITSTNPGYATSETPVVLKLTVTGQGDQKVADEVTVAPQPEDLVIGAAEYRAGSEWRVSGTSNRLADQRVAVVLGTGLTGRVLGFATVDPLGAWSFRGAGGVAPGTHTTVSAVSALGGSQTAFTFRRR